MLLLAWALFWDRSRGRLRCARCAYDMAGGASLTCPECGWTAAGPRQLLGTRRHWRSVWLAAVLILGGSIALAHRHYRGLPGGWWNAAPAGVLLGRITGASDGPRDALWARIRDPDPAIALARPAALSPAEWERLAASCRILILNTASPRSAHSWATVTLGCVIPDETLVHPILGELLVSSTCSVRGIACGGVYPFYLERGHLSPELLDALAQIGGDPACPAEAEHAAGILARVNPLPRDHLLRVVASIKDDPALIAVWGALGSGLSGGLDKPVPGARADLVAGLEASPDAAVRAGAAIIRQQTGRWGFRPDD